ncbi:uncharacterized protein BKA55DRAFT_663538 [Fusarium redolens]|uniref:C2H2-type domain-containing protein n=1 Tax=Fusarium redolens TaxID=48865 RepID=A0A9P9HAL7_FUSRE|nr:uncharacterized protein BKA55DRAFT_663538 [Fusarium redolens]KAH7254224.1 hypothetical protein BKA55DRAFT_663538 [Fusarium redolens]
MKIGRKCYAFEPRGASGRSDDSSHIDHALACTPKDGESTDCKAPRPFILDNKPDGQQSQQPYGLSGCPATTSQAQHEHAFNAQEGLSYRVSRKETSDVMPSHEMETLGETKLSSPDENALEVLGDAETNPILLPESACWDQISGAKSQKELLRSGDKTTVKSSKRPAEENKVFQKRSRTDVPNDTKKRLETFACPYYRKDPERYFDCINLRLIRISDVKQHLKRRHTWSYSCSRCFRGFSLQKTYEEHVLQRDCPIKDCINNDSVSPAAQKTLKDRVDRSSSPELQWHEICRVLFGKVGDALNPHHDGVFKEITGIMRGIWRDEEHNIIASLRDTQNVPCADQLRPLLSEILTRVEDCFEQKEQKAPKENLKEPTDIIQDTHKGALQGGKTGHACEPPSGASSNMLNTGPIEVVEPVGLPTQEWHFSEDFDTSNTSNYTFNCLMPPQYQSQQFEYSYIDLSTSLLHSNIGMDWHLMGPNNDISMENFMSSQSSMESCLSPEDYICSGQMPKDF